MHNIENPTVLLGSSARVTGNRKLYQFYQIFGALCETGSGFRQVPTWRDAFITNIPLLNIAFMKCGSLKI